MSWAKRGARQFPKLVIRNPGGVTRPDPAGPVPVCKLGVTLGEAPIAPGRRAQREPVLPGADGRAPTPDPVRRHPVGQPHLSIREGASDQLVQAIKYRS